MDFIREVFNNFPHDYNFSKLLLDIFNVEFSMWKGGGEEGSTLWNFQHSNIQLRNVHFQHGNFNVETSVRNFQPGIFHMELSTLRHCHVAAKNSTLLHGIFNVEFSTWNFQCVNLSWNFVELCGTFHVELSARNFYFPRLES
jgi:hypothetical protein